MDRDETLVDIVVRLEKAVERLNMLMDGSQALGVDGLTTRINHIEKRLDNMQAQRASMWQWTLGYVLFIVGVLMASHNNVELFGITPIAGAIGGTLVWMLAAVFFLSGLGWLKWR